MKQLFTDSAIVNGITLALVVSLFGMGIGVMSPLWLFVYAAYYAGVFYLNC